MSSVDDIILQIKKSTDISTYIASLIGIIQEKFNKKLKKSNKVLLEKIKNVEAKQTENSKIFNSIIERLDKLEEQSADTVEIDYNYYYETVMSKLENIDKSIKKLEELPVDDILTTYGDKSSVFEMKNIIKSKEKVTINSPLGKVFYNIICQNDLRSANAIYPFLNISECYKSDWCDFNGFTPLNIAVSKNCKGIAQLLIDNGADVNEKDQKGYSPLFLSSGHKELSELLVLRGAKKFPEVTKEPEELEKDIFKAAEKGDLVSIQYLNENCNVDFNQKNSSGKTPLFYAVEFSNLHVMEYLVEVCGVNGNVKTKFGQTPLLCAAMKGNLDVFKYLVEKCKADIKQKDEDGWTSLHLAAYKGNIDIVKYLVENFDLDISEKNNDLNSPLKCAKSWNHTDVVDYLMRKGAR